MRRRTQWMLLAFGLAIAWSVLMLSSCGRGANDSSSQGRSVGASDGTTTESAVSVIEDVTNDGDTSGTGGVTFQMPATTGVQVAWYAPLLPVRTAHAAALAPPFSCGTPTWGGTTDAVTLTPSGCTYTHGTTTWTITWSGALLFSYPGTAGCTGGDFGAVSSTLTSGCIITRSTDTTLTRSISDGTNTYAVIHNTHSPSGWDSTISTDSGGVVITCGSDNCPALNASTGTRSFAIHGTHLTGKLNGVTFWDHTLSTDSADPIVVTGSGSSRQVISGTVYVQHNLVHSTAKVTVTSAQGHTTDCAYPVGGSIEAEFIDGKWSGKTETLAFGPNCGDATLTKSDGSAASVTLVN